MYRIAFRYGHFEVHDANGRFVLSADTETEAMHEIGLLESGCQLTASQIA